MADNAVATTESGSRLDPWKQLRQNPATRQLVLLVAVAGAVAFGGGVTIVKGCPPGRSGRNSPFASQCAYQRASIAAGSKVLSSSFVIARAAMPARFPPRNGLRQSPLISGACRPMLFAAYAEG